MRARDWWTASISISICGSPTECGSADTTSPKAEIELSGRIRLRQDPGQPMQFFGKVEPVPGRGTLDVYGREFRLTGGDIRLNGPVDSTTLDVTAEYQVPTQGGPDDEGVVVDVAAKGHLDSLALEFTSQPDMSQDDILSYIVTGRPSSDNPLAQGSGRTEHGRDGGRGGVGHSHRRACPPRRRSDWGSTSSRSSPRESAG